MAILKNKQAASKQRLDWRADAKFQAAEKAHREHKAKIPELERMVDHSAALRVNVEAARKLRIRGEMELLAGKQSEADVALLRNREIEAQRQLAIAEIQLEDAEADAHKLQAKLDAARVAAKQTAAADLRARYQQALVDVKSAMEQAFAADEMLHQVLEDLHDQFGKHGGMSDQPDADGFPRHLGLRRAFPNQAGVRLLVEEIDKELAKLAR